MAAYYRRAILAGMGIVSPGFSEFMEAVPDFEERFGKVIVSNDCRSDFAHFSAASPFMVDR